MSDEQLKTDLQSRMTDEKRSAVDRYRETVVGHPAWSKKPILDVPNVQEYSILVWMIRTRELYTRGRRTWY